MILEKFFNFLDVNIHHKRIAKFLINYNIETVIDIGSHKGEVLDGKFNSKIEVYKHKNFSQMK